MSSEQHVPPCVPVVPDGVYKLRFGTSVGLGGEYFTAPVHAGVQVTIGAQRPHPGKTQKVRLSYDTPKKSYLIRTDLLPGVGISYSKAAPHGHIVTGAPRHFDICLATPVISPPHHPRIYRISIGGGSTEQLVVGPAKHRKLELQSLAHHLQSVWQLIPVSRESGECDDDEEEEEEEEFSGDEDE